VRRGRTNSELGNRREHASVSRRNFGDDLQRQRCRIPPPIPAHEYHRSVSCRSAPTVGWLHSPAESTDVRAPVSFEAVQGFGPPPRRVQTGDTVAVVSPSFGAPGAWPHRAQRSDRSRTSGRVRRHRWTRDGQAFYEDEDVSVLWDVITQRTAAAAIPALGNLDIGHTDPLLTLPLGARAQLDAGGRRLRVTDDVTTPP
jgi:hypothetical protein